MLLPKYSPAQADGADTPLLTLEYDGDGPNRVDNNVFQSAVQYVILKAVQTIMSADVDLRPQVVLIGLDRPPQEYLTWSEKLRERHSRLKCSILDCFGYVDGCDSDKPIAVPRNLGQDVVISRNQNIGRDELRSLAERVQGLLTSSGEGCRTVGVLVVDSINSLQRKHSISKVMEFYSRLRSQPGEIISVSRRKTRILVSAIISSFRNPGSSQFARTVRDVSSTHVLLSQVHRDAAVFGGAINNDPRQSIFKMDVVRRRPSGRVSLESVLARIHSKGALQAVEESTGDKQYPRSNPQGDEMKADEATDMMSNLGLPFNVAVSKSEKQARAKVALSYEHQDEALANMALERNPHHLVSGFVSDSGDGESDAYGTDPEQDSEDDLDV